LQRPMVSNGRKYRNMLARGCRWKTTTVAACRYCVWGKYIRRDWCDIYCF